MEARLRRGMTPWCDGGTYCLDGEVVCESLILRRETGEKSAGIIENVKFNAIFDTGAHIIIHPWHGLQGVVVHDDQTRAGMVVEGGIEGFEIFVGAGKGGGRRYGNHRIAELFPDILHDVMPIRNRTPRGEGEIGQGV